LLSVLIFLSFNDTAPTYIYTLSLHDALPILDTNKVLSVNPNIGSSSDAHTSSVGKCLLAFSKDIDFEKVSKKPLKEYTENTLSKDRKSTRLNSSHVSISYAVFCLKKKKKK